MTNDDIKKQLLELADPQYQIFSSGLIPNVNKDSILGVRLPQLRKIAKSIIIGFLPDTLCNIRISPFFIFDDSKITFP